jgi:hypothetical protein
MGGSEIVAGGDGMRMKMTLGIFALTWFVAGLTHADTIGLYADIGGTNCNIELQPYLTYIHVVHVTDGAMGCKFMAPRPECLAGAIPVGDQCVMAPPSCCCGDSQTGMTIEYGSCRSGAFEILRMVYRRGPDMDPCCVYPLLAHPESPGGQVMVMDCGSNEVPAVVLAATVQGNATCPCGYPVPVEKTAWGKVKSLYVD